MTDQRDVFESVINDISSWDVSADDMVELAAGFAADGTIAEYHVDGRDRRELAAAVAAEHFAGRDVLLANLSADDDSMSMVVVAVMAADGTITVYGTTAPTDAPDYGWRMFRPAVGPYMARPPSTTG